jgi:GAF domain-containing protein
MAMIRDVIKRDIGVKVEGVVKVFDRSALASEVREYVVTDKIEEELKRILDTFTYTSGALRNGASSRDVMGIWVSGFFGSGKSHFAKVLGYLLQNHPLPGGSGESCIDAFQKHLSDSQRGRNIALRLAEVKTNTQVQTIAFEIKSRQSLTSPGSVGEILLSEFYRHLGYSEHVALARIEQSLDQSGLLGKLEAEFLQAHGVEWKSAKGRDDLLTVKNRLAKVLPFVAPSDYPTESDARDAINTVFRHQKITAEGIADELVAWVDAQKPLGGRVQHLVFVIDEMGTFIGDSTDRIGELNSLAEMIGNKGKGKVWLVVTSQMNLEKVVDHTNFQPALVGRLNARFELKPHLISDEIGKVVSERILKKHPSQEAVLRELYAKHEGHIAQLADLKASRQLDIPTESTFVDAYPLLPHQIRLAQDIFEALSGFRLSGGVRSMISVVMEALQRLADAQVGAIVSFDQVFDAVENDLLSQEYLGTSGVGAIKDSDTRVPGTPILPSRVLKVLYLLQRISWVPRIPETLAKLLVQDLTTDPAVLRTKVEATLGALQDAGYVARDEASQEWKFLSERERTIEQAIQEMVRAGDQRSIPIAAIRRTVLDFCKNEVLAKRRLANYTVQHGNCNTLFPYAVQVDGEAIDSGPELELRFLSPLAAGRGQDLADIRQANQQNGPKGKVVWWVASVPDNLETRLKRHEALVKVTTGKPYTDDSSSETMAALAEKRKERDDLKRALVGDLERAFLSGTVFYGGQELSLDGPSDLKEPVKTALKFVIPNVFTRFSPADRPLDFAKQLKAVLNQPLADLHKLLGGLELFDTQGSLLKESPLVLAVLEVVKDEEDAGRDPTGELLLSGSGKAKTFPGFSRAPYGWPEDLTKLVLAACFRGGALYLEQQSSSGPAPIYEPKGTDEFFTKVRQFQVATFRVSGQVNTIDELKLASKALGLMGVPNVPESSNAIADAVRKLGAKLSTRVGEAKSRDEHGLPIPKALLVTESELSKPTTPKDPAKVVTAFLASANDWRQLADAMKELDSFLQANRHKDFEAANRLLAMAKDHPLPDGEPQQADFLLACADMNALVAQRAVVSRWHEFSESFGKAFAIYKDVYGRAYQRVLEAAELARQQVLASDAYQHAPQDRRDQVVQTVFGPGRACHFPVITLGTVKSLLEVSGRHSLSSLESALVALAGYQTKVEDELRALVPDAPQSGTQRLHEWRPGKALAGMRLSSPEEVDDLLASVGHELKAKIREGFTVVVK